MPRPRRPRRPGGRAPAARRRRPRRGIGPEPQQSDRAAADPVVAIQLDGDCRAGDGEIAVPAGELLDGEAAAPAPDRKAHRGQQLVGLHGSAPQPGEEVRGGDACGRRVPTARPSRRPAPARPRDIHRPGRRARWTRRRCRGCGSGSDRRTASRARAAGRWRRRARRAPARPPRCPRPRAAHRRRARRPASRSTGRCRSGARRRPAAATASAPGSGRRRAAWRRPRARRASRRRPGRCPGGDRRTARASPATPPVSRVHATSRAPRAAVGGAGGDATTRCWAGAQHAGPRPAGRDRPDR